jgi:hypothetical protein
MTGWLIAFGIVSLWIICAVVTRKFLYEEMIRDRVKGDNFFDFDSLNMMTVMGPLTILVYGIVTFFEKWMVSFDKKFDKDTETYREDMK